MTCKSIILFYGENEYDNVIIGKSSKDCLTNIDID